MTIELAATLALGVGLYLLVYGTANRCTAYVAGCAVGQFDADARVAERRTPKWAVRPPSAVGGSRRCGSTVARGPGRLRRVLGAEGSFGAELERQLRLLRPGPIRVCLSPSSCSLAAVLRLRCWFSSSRLASFRLSGCYCSPRRPGRLLGASGAAAGTRKREARAHRDGVAGPLSSANARSRRRHESLDRALLAVARRSAGPLGRALLAAQKEVVGDRRLKDALADLAGREQVSVGGIHWPAVRVGPGGAEVDTQPRGNGHIADRKNALRARSRRPRRAASRCLPRLVRDVPDCSSYRTGAAGGTVLSLLGHSS